MASPDLLDLMENQVCLDLMDSVENLDHQDLMANLEVLDHVETKVNKDLLDQVVLLDLLDRGENLDKGMQNIIRISSSKFGATEKYKKSYNNLKLGSILPHHS